MRNPLGKVPFKVDDGIMEYGEGSGGRLAPPLGPRQSKAREVLVIWSQIGGGLYLEHKDEEDAVREDNDDSERKGADATNYGRTCGLPSGRTRWGADSGFPQSR